jgi:SAM-dependent methyltransferase
MSDLALSPPHPARHPPRADTAGPATGATAAQERAHRARLAVARRQIRDANLVVEVGCGEGRLIADLAILARRAVGIDDRAEAVAAARRRVEDTGSANVAFLCADPLAAARDNDPPGLVDLLILSHVLDAHPDPRSLLAAWARRIGPWGRIVVFAVNARGPAAWLRRMAGIGAGGGLTPARLADLGERVGLEARRVRPVPWAGVASPGGGAVAAMAARIGARSVPGLAAAFAMTLVRPGARIVPIRSGLHGSIAG